MRQPIFFDDFSNQELLLRQPPDMLFEDMIRGAVHCAVVEALNLIESNVLVANEFQHTVEISLFLVTAEEFQFPIARDNHDWRSVRTDKSERSVFIKSDLIRRKSLFLTDIVMRNHLTAERHEACNLVGVSTIFIKVRLVETHDIEQVSASRMSCKENLLGVTVVFFAVSEGPGHRLRNVVEHIVDRGLVHESVIDCNHHKARVLEFGIDMLVASLDTASVKPNHHGNISGIGWVIDIQLASLLRILVLAVGIRNIINALILSACAENHQHQKDSKNLFHRLGDESFRTDDTDNTDSPQIYYYFM